MNAEGISARWAMEIEKDLDYLRERVRSAPHLGLRALNDALDLRAYRFDLDIAGEFARRAVEEIQALLDERSYERLSPLEAKEPDPIRRFFIESRKAELLRGLEYASAAYGGAWSTDGLLAASSAYEAAIEVVPARQWDLPDQWRAISAAILRLEAGDFERALAVLRTKRSFSDTRPLHSLLLAIADELVRAHGKLEPEGKGAASLDGIFNALRNPEPDAGVKAFGRNVINDLSIRRFEFAVLRERYLTGNSGTPDWRRVFHSISADASRTA